MPDAIAERYPVSHELEDGAKVTCSLMSHEDRDALSRFLSRLTRNDLAYLQFDVTNPEIQARWFDSIAAGKSLCLCAYDPAGLVGYASVQVSDGGVGEIRVNISQGYRSRGLGRILTREIMTVAGLKQIKTVTARMLSNQHGARAAFERLGFTRREVLKNHVKDPSVACRDLLVMSMDL